MYDIFKEIWKNPGAVYSPYPMWSWNGNENTDELISRLDGFHKKGIDAVIIKLDGLDGNEEKLKTVLEAAQKRFMLLYICDTLETAQKSIVEAEKRASERVLTVKPSSERNENDETMFSVYVKLDGKLLEDVKIGKCDGYTQYDIVLDYGRDGMCDMLNPYCSERLIAEVYEKYVGIVKDYIGKTAVGFCILPREKNNAVLWSYETTEKWMENGGDIPSLVALLIEPKVKKQRREAEFIYDRIIREGIFESYISPVSSYCTSCGLMLCGDVESDSGNAYAAKFDIPLYVNDGADDNERLLMLKAAADIARHNGREYTSALLFEDKEKLTPDELMCEVNRAFACGANMIIHGENGTESSLEAMPVWCEYRKAASYIKRMSWLGAMGANEPVCAVLCSEDYIPTLPVNKLCESGYTFNYLTIDDLMNKAHIHDGEIHIDRYAYKVLLVDTRLRLSTEIVEKIGRFVTEEGLLYRGTDFATFLGKHVKRKNYFVPADDKSELTFMSMTKGGYPFYAIFNHGEHTVVGSLVTEHNCAADSFDVFSGKTSHIEAEMTERGFEYKLSIPEHSVKVVGFDKDSMVRLKKESAEAELTLAEIQSIAFDEQGRAVFDVREDTKRAVISALDISGVIEVKINGEKVGRLIFKPYSLDVTAYVKSGENTVETERCGEVTDESKLLSQCTIRLYK